MFLPFEIYELTERVSPLKVIGFVINLAVVVYLIYAKRLFGLRGGGAVERRERERDMRLGADRAHRPGGDAGGRGDGRDRLTSGRPTGSRRSSASCAEIGAELAAAFPSAARHPLRALDARAMELASADESCERRCSGSSTSSRRAARSTTSPAT